MLAISITSMAWQSTMKENDKKKIANEYTRESVNTHLFVDGGIQNVTLGTTWIKTEQNDHFNPYGAYKVITRRYDNQGFFFFQYGYNFLLDMVSLLGIWQVFRKGTQVEKSLIKENGNSKAFLRTGHFSTCRLQGSSSVPNNFSKVTLSNIRNNLVSTTKIAEKQLKERKVGAMTELSANLE